MGVHDVEALPLYQRSQPQSRTDVQRIAEREFNLRVHGSTRAAGDDDGMAKVPKSFRQLNDMSFAAAELRRRTNL
jgi:hypothetical protein